MFGIDDIKQRFTSAANYFLVRKVRNRKARLRGDYLAAPETTAILQFFNKERNIDKILPRITRAFDETIVIDDGSVDGSWRKLAVCLEGRNNFLIRSNDLYEVVMYDRAMHFARGKIVCLLQDDDIPPEDDAWVRSALVLFDHYPELQILGGKNGLDVLPREQFDAMDEADQSAGVRILRHADINHYRFYHKPIYRAAELDLPFMFSVAINRAPMFVRREAFLAAGGVDQAFRPFQCDDVDACLRAWQSGAQVGLYEAPFHRNVGRGGMRLFNDGAIGNQARNNWDRIYQRYASAINDRSIANKVNLLNQRLLMTRPHEVASCF